MAIVRISEALLERSNLTDGTILRDRMLSGFCVRMNARKKTFRVATSVAGKQFRMNLGYWPLMSVDEARGLAMQVPESCRAELAQPRKYARPCWHAAPPTTDASCTAAGAPWPVFAAALRSSDDRCSVSGGARAHVRRIDLQIESVAAA